MYAGFEGSSSIFFRSHEMWTSRVFVGPNQCGSQTSSMISSRPTTSPARDIRSFRRSNSLAASSIGSPPFVTAREDGSRVIAPIVIGDRRALGGAAAALDRADPRDELPRRERLHDVVVGAELEADDPVDLFAPGGEHHDRHVGVGADVAAEVPAVPVRQHHVEQDHVGLVSADRLASGLDRAGDLRREPLARQM